MAILKIIHYCWFGGKELPEELKQCMKTWDILTGGRNKEMGRNEL